MEQVEKRSACRVGEVSDGGEQRKFDRRSRGVNRARRDLERLAERRSCRSRRRAAGTAPACRRAPSDGSTSLGRGDRCCSRSAGRGRIAMARRAAAATMGVAPTSATIAAALTNRGRADAPRISPTPRSTRSRPSCAARAESCARDRAAGHAGAPTRAGRRDAPRHESPTASGSTAAPKRRDLAARRRGRQCAQADRRLQRSSALRPRSEKQNGRVGLYYIGNWPGENGDACGAAQGAAGPLSAAVGLHRGHAGRTRTRPSPSTSSFATFSRTISRTSGRSTSCSRCATSTSSSSC